jgi:hypothetical protein
MHYRPNQRGRWRPACAATLAALLSLTPGTADAAITLDAGVVLLTGSTSPSAGTVAGGTTVDITSVESLLAIAENAALQASINLLGLASVTVDGTPTLADVEFGGVPTPGADLQQSLFTVRSVTPAHAAGTVPVDLVYHVTVKGQLVLVQQVVDVTVRLRLANGYTYVAAPTLTSVAPGSGPEAGGTSVTITGSNFRSGMVARFGGVAATGLLVVSPTTVTATSPPGTGTVAVSIENADNESATMAGAFTYTPSVVAPTISALAPSSGPSAGGTGVLVTGTGLQPGATVAVGGALATQVVVSGPTQMTFTTPAGSAGPVPVVVTNPDGGTVTFNSFTYVPQSTPTITSVSPTSGPTSGGITTVITGTGFDAGATVTLCGTIVTPSSVSATTIVFATPSCGTAGPAAIQVKNPDGGTATAAAAYTFSAPPAITSVSPNSGTVNGGTVITISGTGFQSGSTVLLDATAGTDVVVVDATTIVATTPAHAAGQVGVQVTNPDGGKVIAANAFTYTVVSTPDILTVTPSQGTPGSAATLNGTGFINGATVTMCGVTATGGFVDATQVTFVVPMACPAGAQDIRLTNPDGGTDTIGGGFQVGAGTSTPTATSLAPTSGPVSGGTSVGISGTGFLSGATVLFGATPATSVTVVSSTLITAVSPAGSAGLVAVQVTNPDTGSATVPGGFTYLAQSAPTMTSLSPAQGPVSGGTTVVVSGAGFQPGATVLLGATAVPVSSLTPTALTFTTPACAAGPHAVTVTNPDGGTVTMPGAFTCVAVSQPSTASVSPGLGPIAGGTAVQVGGSGFVAGASVMFGSAPLANVMVLSPAVITGTTTAHPAGTVAVTVTNPDGGTTSLPGAFTYQAGACAISPTDADGDCLPDTWETDYGLDPHSGVCPDGPACDPDGDGETNLHEYEGGTHPRGFYRQYFAEGVVSDMFRTLFQLVSPGQPSTTARVQVRYLRQGGTSAGQSASTTFSLVGTALRVVDPVASLGAGAHEFATVIESDAVIAAARTVAWDATTYGSHAEVGVATPSTTWHFAEGATIAGFQLFYLLSNPAAIDATVTMTYLRPYPLSPIVRQHVVPARARVTVWVNQEAPELAAEEMSATITSTIPVLAERAMYRHSPSRVFASGHAAAGVTAPRASWLFAEGATGPYFDTFLLVSNPHQVDLPVRVTYLLPDGGTKEETFVVGRQSRFNVWVDTRPGLEDTAFSARIDVVGDGTVIAERAMWWPGDGTSWHEGHVSSGAPSAGTAWVVAQGVDGGLEHAETYVLVANVGGETASVRVDVIAEDGTSASQVITVGANSRTNVPVTQLFPAMTERRFGVMVTSLGANPMPLVVEGSTYGDAGGSRWESGSSAVATRLR